MKRQILICYVITFLSLVGNNIFAQGPWDNDIRIAFSNDGTTFSPSTHLLDSADVPSITLLDDGTLLAAFQWFEGNPNGKVAIITSSDNGVTWTSPTLANFSNQPAGLFKPVDPTVVNLGGGQIRMYFSIGENMITDSTLDVFSAISTDGINYTFEQSVACYSDSIEIIEPAVGLVNGTWHCVWAIGDPWLGASHASSADGLNFTQAPHIDSDTAHSWIGNYMDNGDGTSRYYGSYKYGGSGDIIWWASTTDGNNFGSYNLTNIDDGTNPAVTKMQDGSYVMIFIDKNAPLMGINEESVSLEIYPNPAQDFIYINSAEQIKTVQILDMNGRITKSVDSSNNIEVSELNNGVYFISVTTVGGNVVTEKFIKL